MAPSRKTAVAAAFALMARGIAAISPYYTSATTVSAEPQFLGSSTSADLVLYSFNYCNVVQSTTCQVTVSTGQVATPEYSTYSVVQGDSTTVITVPVSSSTWKGESAASTATSTAAGVDASVTQTITVDFGQPSETASPITDGQASSTAVFTTVISTTDDAGNPTLMTSTSTAPVGWTATSDTASVTEMTSSSVYYSSTARAGYNSTLTSTQQSSSATTGSTSAPKKSGAGASAIPALGLGATIIAFLFLI